MDAPLNLRGEASHIRCSVIQLPMQFTVEKSHVEQMMKKIKEGIEETPFSCALGVSYTDGKKDFNAICRETDQAMYEDKMRMKNIPISIL